MARRTFEFIDVKDWCRPAESPAHFMQTPKSWLPLLAPCQARIRPAPGDLGSLDWLLEKDSSNIAVSIRQETIDVSGSLVANLGPAVVKDSSLLVFVRDFLAIAEGYGDRNWLNFQLNRWPTAHNMFMIQDQAGILPLRIIDIDDSALVNIDEPCLYLSVRADDRNIYHWLYETLPRLICLDVCPALRDLPLLVRSPLSDLQKAFLGWMGLSPRFVVTEGRSVRVSNLFFASLPNPPPLHRELLDWMRRRILPGVPAVPDPRRRRLLISRSDGANGRRLANEEELDARLQPLGFERLVMSKLTPEQQIQAFRHAEIVVLPHGGAGSYMTFTPEDCRFIEIYSPDYLNSTLFSLCKSVGRRYTAVIGWQAGTSNDFGVNCPEIEALVGQMLAPP